MRSLQSKIYSSIYHGVKISSDRIEADLESVLAFQKSYAQNVCYLESHFVNIEIIDAFKILNPSNMPTRQVGLVSWIFLEMNVSCGHYGHDFELHRKKFEVVIKAQRGSFFLLNFKQPLNGWTRV